MIHTGDQTVIFFCEEEKNLYMWIVDVTIENENKFLICQLLNDITILWDTSNWQYKDKSVIQNNIEFSI